MSSARIYLATLNEEGEIEFPGSVVTSRPKPLAEVSGLTKINLAEGSPPYTTFPLKLVGATEIEPTGALANGSTSQIIVNSGTGFAFSLKGVSWIGTEPTEFASGTAGKEYLITLIPVGGKLLAIVGKGEKGAAGIQGETGAKGEVGPSSIEAMTRTSYPYVNNSYKPTGSFVATQWQVLFALVVVPVKAKKLEIYQAFEVVSGHVRAFVFDVGVIKADAYSPLASSSLFEPVTAEKPELIATLERSSGEWEAGECLMVGIGADNTTIKPCNATAVSKGPEALLPGGPLNGTSGMATVRLVGSKTYSEGAFKEASPKEIGEGSMGATTTALAFLCSWV